MKQKPKTCAHCGEEFTPERRNGIYCSQTCRQYSYLLRKTGEVYGLPKKENENVEFSNAPALIIEEEENNGSIAVNKPQCGQPILINLQLQNRKESNQNVHWNNSVDVNSNNQSSQKNQFMKTENFTQTNYETENIPVVILDRLNVGLETEENNDSELDEFIPQKTYAHFLEDQKQNANSDLFDWWDMCKPSKTEKAHVYRFGNRIKPFLKSLLMMDGKQVPIKSLHGWKIEANKIVRSFFPEDECPIFYPPLGFFASDILTGIEEFVKSIELLRVKSVRIKLTGKIKSEAEIAVRIIESFTPNAPEFWVLP